MKNLDLLSDKAVAKLDEIYFHRLANLAFIDDMVGSLIQRLDSHRLLDNTYVVYTTDNGMRNIRSVNTCH